MFKTDEHDTGNLILCNSRNFKLDQCRSSVYLKKCDQLLVFSVENLNSIKYGYSLEVTKDLFIIFNKKQYVGWGLNNASIYSVTYELRNFLLSNERAKQIFSFYLERYLCFFQGEIKSRLENEDPVIKKDIRRLIKRIEEEKLNYLENICEGLYGLVDSYF